MDTTPFNAWKLVSLSPLPAWAQVLLGVGVALGVGLAAVERSRARRFDPNAEDQQARIERGRSRAVTRSEFEARQREPGAEDGA